MKREQIIEFEKWLHDNYTSFYHIIHAHTRDGKTIFDLLDQFTQQDEEMLTIDCPECGEEIQYGLSKEAFERIRKCKIFTQQDEPTTEESAEVDDLYPWHKGRVKSIKAAVEELRVTEYQYERNGLAKAIQNILKGYTQHDNPTTEESKDFENFESELTLQLSQLPYEKHVDDGQYNDGKIVGFELGARWAMEQYKKGDFRKVKCSERLPEKDGWYFIFRTDDFGENQEYASYYMNGKWYELDVESWLEEI